jgi:hypothetical protein
MRWRNVFLLLICLTCVGGTFTCKGSNDSSSFTSNPNTNPKTNPKTPAK